MASKISRAVSIALAGPILEHSGDKQVLANYFGYGAGVFFILGAIVLMAAVVTVLVHTLWTSARAAHEWHAPTAQETAQANTQVYRDQLEELEREYVAVKDKARELRSYL